MTLILAMTEMETSVQQRFTKNVVKIIFVLSPGYAALPEPLQFVYTRVTTLAEGRFNVVITRRTDLSIITTTIRFALSFPLSGRTFRMPSGDQGAYHDSCGAG